MVILHASSVKTNKGQSPHHQLCQKKNTHTHTRAHTQECLQVSYIHAPSTRCQTKQPPPHHRLARRQKKKNYHPPYSVLNPGDILSPPTTPRSTARGPPSTVTPAECRARTIFRSIHGGGGGLTRGRERETLLYEQQTRGDPREKRPSLSPRLDTDGWDDKKKHSALSLQRRGRRGKQKRKNTTHRRGKNEDEPV